MESQYLAWGFILIGVAILLVIVELFIPSGGIIAVVAALAAVGGVVSLFMEDTTWGFIGLAGVVIATPVVIIGGFKIWSSTKIGRVMLGEDAQAEIQRRKAEEQKHLDEIRSLIGLEGEALTDLHPIGTVRIDGRRYDAHAEVRFVDTGARVVVTHANAFEIKVRPA